MGGNRHKVSIARDVPMAMRDGVRLLADIYAPDRPGPWPVLLMRSPYDKSTSEYLSLLHPEWYARHGFIVVTQDVRGCFASEGTFRPFHHEALDGADSIEHCRILPGSNGRVGMYGFSYPGIVQLMAALHRPKGLAAIAPAFTCDGLYQDWTYKNGALQLAFAQSWASALAVPEAFRRGGDADIRAALAAAGGINGAYAHLPLDDHPSLDRRFAPFYYEWLEHPTYDGYWKAIDIAGRHGRIEVPALHIGGWYDIFVEGTIRNFQGLRAGAASEAARAAQRLTIGPWYHQPWSRLTGDIDFGASARNHADELTVRWYRRWLAGEDDGIGAEPPVEIFVMGANRWRRDTDFPPGEARPVTLYLRGDGRANALDGDGRLAREAPADEPHDIVITDPMNPIPSAGGRGCCPPELAPMGPRDQRGIEARPDVLVYSTDVLTADFEVVGPVDIVLWASTTGDDTDFVVKLVDVHPCGRAINIVDSVLRASFRDGLERPTAIEPDRVYRYAFRVGHTANRFKAGHRVRVEIAGTGFPQYERTLNHLRTRHDGGYRDARTATTRVFHDADRPSHVTLSVVPTGG
jgi:hypothetical protein